MQENYKNQFQPKASAHWLNHLCSKRLLQKAKLICAVNEQLKKHLPQPANRYCCLMNWTTKEIIIGVDSAEWLLCVRECEPNIKTCMLVYTALPRMAKIKYRVRPYITHNFLKKAERIHTRSKISAHNRTILRTIASAVSDAKLRDTLLKLADD